MDEFESPPPIAIDRIYVSWDECWDLNRYVDDYLRTRHCVVSDVSRKAVRSCIEHFPAGQGMLTKVNMDFWLDSNGVKASWS